MSDIDKDQVDLGPLVNAVQIHTDDDGRHTDDQGREYEAIDVDGELDFRLIEPTAEPAAPAPVTGITEETPREHWTAFRYEPFTCSPEADPDGNRAIPSQPLEDPIAWLLVRQLGLAGPEDLTDEQRRAVEFTALACVCDVQLDADGEDVVPILTVSSPADTAGHRTTRWALAYKTPAPGLYVTAQPAWFGDAWGISTGSGVLLHRGFSTRADATAAAVRVRAAAPGIDWHVTTTADAWDADTRAAIAAALKSTEATR